VTGTHLTQRVKFTVLKVYIKVSGQRTVAVKGYPCCGSCT